MSHKSEQLREMVEQFMKAFTDIANHANAQLTMEELMEVETPIPWLALFNRMGEELVEKLMDEMVNASDRATNYFYPENDYPPGVPR